MALTDYYVTVTGGATKTGTQGDPFDWATFSARMAGGAAAAGDRYNIQEGAYSIGSTDTWTNDGSATQPIIIRGCLTDWTPIVPTRAAGNLGLDTSHYPVITYGAGYALLANGSSYVGYHALAIVGNYFARLVFTGASAYIYGCHVTNSYNGVSAGAIAIEVRGLAVLCDAVASGAVSYSGLYMTGSASRVVGCLVSDSGGTGIAIAGSDCFVANNVIYGHAGYGIYGGFTAVASLTCLGNTIYGGKGIGFANTAYTGLNVFLDNHITDGSAYGIEYLYASGGPSFMAWNRTRDNASGAISIAGDWAEATTIGHVTTDTGGAETDCVNAGAGNLNLISAAPGKSAGLMGADIGGLQRAEPTYPAAGDVQDGAADYGDVFAQTSPTRVDAAEANVFFGTGNYGDPASPLTPAMRASDIENCEAANIKNGITIDDVTGNLTGGGVTTQEIRDAMLLAPSATPAPATDSIDAQLRALALSPVAIRVT